MSQSKQFWNEEMETMSPEKMKKLQEERLQKLLPYVYQRSLFFKDLWDQHNVKVDEIKTLEDFREKIPLCDKDDLREFRKKTGDPSGGLRCVESSEEGKGMIGSISTGTTGEATLHFFTPKDIDVMTSEVGARILWGAGLRPGGRFFNDMPHHLIRLTFETGASKIGATTLYKIIPQLAPTEFDRHHLVFKYFQPTHYFIVSPPALNYFRAEFEKRGLKPEEFFPKGMVGLYGGETISRRTRECWTEWGIELHNISGTGDFQWIPTECKEHDGLHSMDDLVLVEVVDPVTLAPLPPGSQGELVITTLVLEGCPTVRFRMGDIVRTNVEKCRCGRTSTRLEYLGRVSDEAKVAGKSIFPIHIREIAEEFPETEEAITQTVLYAPEMDVLKLRVVYNPSKTKDLADLKTRFTKRLESALGVRSEIEFLEPSALSTALTHKFVRVVKEY